MEAILIKEEKNAATGLNQELLEILSDNQAERDIKRFSALNKQEHNETKIIELKNHEFRCDRLYNIDLSITDFGVERDVKRVAMVECIPQNELHRENSCAHNTHGNVMTQTLIGIEMFKMGLSLIIAARRAIRNRKAARQE